MTNKRKESSAGYWTDKETRGLSLCIKNLDAKVRVSVSSEYWYRVQHFDLTNTIAKNIWNIIKLVMKDCGRMLIAIHDESKAEANSILFYRLDNLSEKQTNQIYYLLKHAFTKNKLEFTISHTLRFDTSIPSLIMPKKKRRRRRGRTESTTTTNEWHII